MPIFMTQTKYSEESLKAMAEHPSDRPKQMSKVIESFGGKLLHFYWVFGDTDVIAIYEAPDSEAVFSIVLTLSHGGAIASQKTLSLLSNEQAMSAMSRAKGADTGYTSPVEEWEGWHDDGGEG